MGEASVIVPPVLELSAVSRRYGSVTGLRPVTLRVEPGTTCLVHGANGSGKTTLLRVCAGLLTPTTGARSSVGRCLYLRPGSGTRRRQTVHEVLVTVGALSRQPSTRIEDAMEAVGLAPLSTRRVETLSSGQHGRLLVGIALATMPALACLDEPTAQLDEDGVETVRRGVLRLVAAGTAVLIATHDRTLLAQDPDARLLVEDGAVKAAP